LSHFRQTGGIDLQKRDIRFSVRSNKFGAEFALVRQFHMYFVRGVYEVGVGQDITIRADNESRAEGFRFEILGHSMGRSVTAEEFEEGIVLRNIRHPR
jgi:hypothetical protein